MRPEPTSSDCQPGDRAVSDLDPFSAEFLADPYPYHEELRASGSVVWLSRYGIWAAARHQPVQAALGDWQTFCSSAGVGLSDFRKEAPWRTPSLVLEADPPLHTRTRAVLTRILSPAALRGLRAAFEREPNGSSSACWSAGGSTPSPIWRRRIH